MITAPVWCDIYCNKGFWIVDMTLETKFKAKNDKLCGIQCQCGYL